MCDEATTILEATTQIKEDMQSTIDNFKEVIELQAEENRLEREIMKLEKIKALKSKGREGNRGSAEKHEEIEDFEDIVLDD